MYTEFIHSDSASAIRITRLQAPKYLLKTHCERRVTQMLGGMRSYGQWPSHIRTLVNSAITKYGVFLVMPSFKYNSCEDYKTCINSMNRGTFYLLIAFLWLLFPLMNVIVDLLIRKKLMCIKKTPSAFLDLAAKWINEYLCSKCCKRQKWHCLCFENHDGLINIFSLKSWFLNESIKFSAVENYIST